MTGPPAVLAPAAKRARLMATFLKGRPVWCTWQLAPRCASLCVFCDHRAEGTTGELDLAGCRAGRSFFNVDHRGRVSKCLEFRRPEDQAGNLASESADGVVDRLRVRNAENRCQACWMSSRGEVEGLYTWRGFLGGLAALVRP